MRQTGLCLSLAAAAIALAGAAHAAPLNLAWDQCLSEGGIPHKYFACDTNARYEFVVGSFVPPTAIADFMGLTAVINGVTGGYVALPDWWQLFYSGACRQYALSCSFDFFASPNTACTDPWQGTAAGGIGAYYTAANPSPVYPTPPYALQVKLAGGLANPTPIQAGTEYYGFRLAISHVRTTGVGACDGCVAGLCLTLAQVDLYRDNGTTVTMYPDHGTSADPYVGTAVVTWQCAAGEMYFPGHGPVEFSCNTIGNCSVPAKNRTWGSIKALYR